MLWFITWCCVCVVFYLVVLCLCPAKSGLYLDTLDAERLKKIRTLENYERPLKSEAEPDSQAPVFLTALTSLEALKEGEHAHLECRVEPINDPTLKVSFIEKFLMSSFSLEFCQIGGKLNKIILVLSTL